MQTVVVVPIGSAIILTPNQVHAEFGEPGQLKEEDVPGFYYLDRVLSKRVEEESALWNTDKHHGFEQFRTLFDSVLNHG